MSARTGTEAPSIRIESELRRMIVTGSIEAGAWLREETLAQTFGASRTPVREACSRLANEGLLERMPRRGFRSLPLDPVELQEVYPVLVSLEMLAIRTRREPIDELVDSMTTLNSDAAAMPNDAGVFYEIDSRWHFRLVGASQNSVLMEMHRRLCARLSRFIHVYWGDPPDVSRSMNEHQLIISAVARDDKELACALIRSHRQQGYERIQSLM